MPDELIIEDGIPIPARKYGRQGVITAALKALGPGESVLVPGKTIRQIGPFIAKARSSIPKSQFASRTTDEGLRVWRTK